MVKTINIRISDNKTRRTNVQTYSDPPAILHVLFWYSLIITDIFRKATGIESLVELVRNSIYFIVAFSVLYDAIKRRRIQIILIPFSILMILILLSVLIYPALISEVNEVGPLLILRCLPGFYLATNVTDWKLVLKKIAQFYWLGLLYSIIIAVYGERLFNYMTISYSLFVPAVITIQMGSLYKKKIWFISGLIMGFVMIVYGARGPILCVAVTLLSIYYQKREHGRMSKRQFLLLCFLFFALVFLIVRFDTIVQEIARLAPNSRTIAIIQGGAFTDDSGRSSFYMTVLSALARDPILPHGILADRMLIFNGTPMNSSFYPHNFVLELWYQFGIFGLVFVFIFFRNVFQVQKKLIANKEGLYDTLIMVAYSTFCLGALTKLMITGTYVSDMQAWYCFGTLLSINRLIKYEKREVLSS